MTRYGAADDLSRFSSLAKDTRSTSQVRAKLACHFYFIF